MNGALVYQISVAWFCGFSIALVKTLLTFTISIRNLLVLKLETIVWQTGDILLDEWESLLIIVTYEIEGEVLGIAVELLYQSPGYGRS